MRMGRDPETYRIDDSAWENGWREHFGSAIEKALEPYRDGEEVQIKEIWVKKRGDTSWHDYRIVL